MKLFGFDRLSRRGKILVGAGAGVVLVAVGVALYVNGRTGDTYNPNARFIHQPPPKPRAKPAATFNWNLFGYNAQHTRYFPAPASLAPPFRIHWRHDGGGLLEFPPVIRDNLLFQLVDSGELYALNTETGRVVWHRRLGRLAASTPALDANDLYVTLLEGPSGGVGRAVALEQKTGRIIWSKTLGSRSESSPMLDASDVFFGSEAGTVYALDKATGRTIWTYQAAGAVKASPTLADGNLFFGDYGGQVQAISARTGAVVWKSQSEGAALGSGTFYSTAAVIYGRVYLGNTDGHVYAYDERSGSLDWAVQTGSYVYASPAVTETPGLGPTVYVGSYTGEFYALNAQTGTERWTYPAGGKISGSATIIGHVVYFAALGTHELLGLATRTGRRLFRFPDGAFDPGISDGHRLYLSGGYTLYAFEPRR